MRIGLPSLVAFGVLSCIDPAPVGEIASELVTSGYDTRLDDADMAIEKAIVLLGAAQDPSHLKKPFGGHVDKAIAALDKAREEIVAAKEAADATP